jgi:hypothetical protein
MNTGGWEDGGIFRTSGLEDERRHHSCFKPALRRSPTRPHRVSPAEGNDRRLR